MLCIIFLRNFRYNKCTGTVTPPEIASTISQTHISLCPSRFPWETSENTLPPPGEPPVLHGYHSDMLFITEGKHQYCNLSIFLV